MPNITIEQVNDRIKELSDVVSKYNKAIADANAEYQQLLGYKQALIDLSKGTTPAEPENDEISE